jgi:lactoylglutathione lyase
VTGWFEQTGVILFVEHYERCVTFYRDVLELAIEEENPALVRFGFGGAYLMVERGGAGRPEGKSRAENPVTLRFNVADFDRAVKRFAEKGVAADIRHWDWGTTAHFLDPDGNRIEVRDPFHN